VRFLGQAAVGTFGLSIKYHQPVADVLAAAITANHRPHGHRARPELRFGVALGAWQASRHGTAADRITGTASLIVASLPEFWLGLVLLLLFSSRSRSSRATVRATRCTICFRSPTA
jgi:peptide/nickel transport system permease protein